MADSKRDIEWRFKKITKCFRNTYTYKGGLQWDPWLNCVITADGGVRKIIVLKVGKGYKFKISMSLFSQISNRIS